MYNVNRRESSASYVGVSSQYLAPKYVAKPPRKISNIRLMYDSQDHNPAKYKWR